jgi:hypothetical protein
MPSHDFNKPCDCSECRRDTRNICCPSCNEKSVLVTNRQPEWSYYKGTRVVDFKSPIDDEKTFTCHCGYEIPGVGYYSYYDKEATQQLREREDARATAAKCDECGDSEGFDQAPGFRANIELKEHDGQLLCQNCLANQIQFEKPNPSTSTEKYEFNRHKLDYVLIKVKLPCINCKKERWLNVENQWKKLCSSCYKLQQF